LTFSPGTLCILIYRRKEDVKGERKREGEQKEWEVGANGERIK
jgi:hypothetical protein